MAAGGVAVTVAGFTGESIAGGAVLPRFVVEQWQTLLAPVPHCVVDTLADCINLGATATRVTVTCTSGECKTAER